MAAQPKLEKRFSCVCASVAHLAIHQGRFCSLLIDFLRLPKLFMFISLSNYLSESMLKTFHILLCSSHFEADFEASTVAIERKLYRLEQTSLRNCKELMTGFCAEIFLQFLAIVLCLHLFETTSRPSLSYPGPIDSTECNY